MTARINEEIAEALQQQGRPLQALDAAGKVYYIMTDQQFQRYAYDDSELTPDEMMAAASSMLDDQEGWGALGMDQYDQADSDTAP